MTGITQKSIKSYHFGMVTAELNLKKGEFCIVKHCFKANKNDCIVFRVDEFICRKIGGNVNEKRKLDLCKHLGFLIIDEKETVLPENVFYELPQLKTKSRTSRA